MLEQKGLIIGLVLGDGSIWKNKTLQFSNKDIDLIGKFYKLVKNTYGFKGKIRVTKSGFTKRRDIKQLLYSVNFTKTLFNEWGEFVIDGNKLITEKMLNSSISFKRGLIKGFILSDGSISINKEKRYNYDRIHFSITQKNKKILEDFKKILEEFNINSNIYPDKDYWKLDILKDSEMLKLINFIGIEFVPEQMRPLLMTIGNRVGKIKILEGFSYGN